MLKKARKEGKLKTKKRTFSCPPRRSELPPRRTRIPRCSQYNMDLDELDRRVVGAFYIYKLNWRRGVMRHHVEGATSDDLIQSDENSQKRRPYIPVNGHVDKNLHQRAG